MCSSAVGLVTAKVTSFQTTRSRCLWLAGICVVLLAGCAGTPPTLPGDRKRVAQKIKARIDARKVTNTASSEPHSFQVVLRVTRYQKGQSVRPRHAGRPRTDTAPRKCLLHVELLDQECRRASDTLRSCLRGVFTVPRHPSRRSRTLSPMASRRRSPGSRTQRRRQRAEGGLPPTV